MSADRRGTLSIPDVESFIVDKDKLVLIDDAVSKREPKKKNKKCKDEEEIIITNKGSRSRPRKQ